VPAISLYSNLKFMLAYGIILLPKKYGPNLKGRIKKEGV
jgi:hypothetical protein